MRRSSGDKKRPSTKRGSKRGRRERPEIDVDELFDFEHENADATGIAYAVAKFPFRGNQTWRDALFDAEFGRRLDHYPARAMYGGVVIGWASMFHDNADEFIDNFAAMPADAVFRDPVSDVKVRRAPGLRDMSERDEANLSLGIFAMSMYEEIVWNFLDVALLAAFHAAQILSMDAAALDPPERSPYWRANATPPVKAVGTDDRAAVVRFYAESMRSLLAETLTVSDDLIRRVGRSSEEARDHRAYCLREWLVKSPRSEFAELPPHLRSRAAKKRVRETVIPNLTESSYERIISNGRDVHRSLVPDEPYCEMWGGGEPPRK